MLCLEKAEECSTFELYRLIQAYGQSAPQIILQLFHMLTQDLFRNFQTSTYTITIYLCEDFLNTQTVFFPQQMSKLLVWYFLP